MEGTQERVATRLTWQRITYPQCFMFCGLSIRMASLIFRSWSGHALVTVILWSSDCLGLLGVGWRTTCTQTTKKNTAKSKTPCSGRIQEVNLLISSCATFSNTNWCVYKGLVIMCVCITFFFESERYKVSQGRETEQGFALPPRRGGLISLCRVERKPAFLPTLLQWEIKEPCHKPRSKPQQGRLRNANHLP